MSVPTYEEWLAGGGERTAGFGGGDGLSVAGAFVLSKIEHFYKLAWDVENGFTYAGTYFHLSCDLDMEGKPWRPIGYFMTPFDKREFGGFLIGGGHTIHSFAIDAEAGRTVGIFGFTDGAEIRDLRIGNFKIAGKGTTGALVGFAISTKISNCHAGGTITEMSDESVNVGGLVGTAGRCVVSGCTAGSKITASGCRGVGGLCGYAYNDTRIDRCRAVREIFASRTIDSGGVVGTLRDSQVSDSAADVAMSGLNNENVGGFCGGAYDSRINACRATGALSNRNDKDDVCVGGFLGHGNSLIAACAASGDVDSHGEGGRVGGFAGSAAESQIRSSYSVGEVAGEGRVGGFIGYLNCTDGAYVRIEDCCAAGDVKVRGEERDTIAAGFVGKIDRDGGSIVIARCYAFGTLYGTPYGFFGENVYATVMNCFWRKDETANAGKEAVHGIPTLTTEEFGVQGRFDAVDWVFDGQEPVWCYTGSIDPARPHPADAPVLTRAAKKNVPNA
ncbi:hypothetical protein LJC31_01240 [Synergistaceae bacterium OttesenSCG-928-I11]|nr:hypothetical protein [Synergistaceae bacterium OttesenSCG-928-I11]